MNIQTWVGASPATRTGEQALRALRAGFDGVVLEPLAAPGERPDPRFGRLKGQPQLPKSGEHPTHRLRELKELALRYPERARVQAVWGGASFQVEALSPWLDHLTGWELWPTRAVLASPRALSHLLKRACPPGLTRPWVRLPLSAAGALSEPWLAVVAEYGAHALLDLEGEGLCWGPPSLDLLKISSYVSRLGDVVLRGGIWSQEQLLGMDISQLRALELTVPILSAGFAGALHGFKCAKPQVIGSPRPKPPLGARPQVTPARCTTCGACITGCEDGGSQCLHPTASGAPVVDLGRCSGCGLCAWLCSSGALRMIRETRV